MSCEVRGDSDPFRPLTIEPSHLTAGKHLLLGAKVRDSRAFSSHATERYTYAVAPFTGAWIETPGTELENADSDEKCNLSFDCKTSFNPQIHGLGIW